MEVSVPECVDFLAKVGEPQDVWRYFMMILQTPRESGNPKQIQKLLCDIADHLKLEKTVDAGGNVIIRKPASPGCENMPGVCLQCHMDMVCAKTEGNPIDFLKDPIRPRFVGDKIMAIGTSLGGDNGIGIAAGLAILADESVKHGPLELLITRDEEIGLKGASVMVPRELNSKYMVNVDSEEEYSICVGCAGGFVTEFNVPIKREAVTDHEYFSFGIADGLGGHSGVQIHENRANALKMAARMLKDELLAGIDVKVVKMDGGFAHNAIPGSVMVTVAVPKDKAARSRT